MSEKKWFEERDALQFMSGRYYIYDRAGNVCPNPELDLRPWEDPLHTGVEDYRDAAKFESRVAAILASKTLCRMDICSTEIECRWCRLKMARLRAEKEMKG